jgi:hypothetical protein
MTKRFEHLQSLPDIDVRLDCARMTVSERQQARHAMEVGARIAALLSAGKGGLKRWLRIGSMRRAQRAARATRKVRGRPAGARAVNALR